MLPETQHRRGRAAPPAPSPTRHRRVTLQDTIVFEAIVAIAYAGVVIIASSSAQGLVARAVRSWLEFSAGFVDAVAWPAHISTRNDRISPASAGVDGLFVYRNVLVFSLVTATVFFLSFRGNWARWALELEATLRNDAWSTRHIGQLADVGYHQLIWGAVAIVLLLLFGEGVLARLYPGVYDVAWMHLRAPLLSSLAFAFACHAGVLSQLRR